MKKIILLIAVVVLTSGCLDTFDGVLAKFSVNTQERVTYVEDLEVSAEAVPREVIEENTGTIFLILENRGNSTLKNVSVDITDPCILDFDKTQVDLGDMSTRKVEEIPFDFRAQASLTERSCSVRYSIKYTSEAAVSLDFIAISEEEFTRMSRDDVDETLNVFYDRSRTPVEIELSLSKDMPIQTGDDFFLYTRITNVGAGDVDPLEVSDFTLSYPSIVNVLECDDFAIGGNLTLSRDLQFAKGETKTITCKMEAGDVTVLEKGKFSGSVDYTYVVRGSVPVSVVPE